MDGWSNTSANGTPLHISDLSGKLTKVGAYRQTICEIQEFDYLMHRLLDQDLPQITAAKQSRARLLEDMQTLIQMLTWQDFELFVDLIFTQSGWRRISSLGNTQKTLDLELLLPTTKERAIIQVKSSTDQAQLDDYIERFASMGADKYFYVYHSSVQKLETHGADIMLLNCEALAEHTLSVGLCEWLIARIG